MFISVINAFVLVSMVPSIIKESVFSPIPNRLSIGLFTSKLENVPRSRCIIVTLRMVPLSSMNTEDPLTCIKLTEENMMSVVLYEVRLTAPSAAFSSLISTFLLLLSPTAARIVF